jgi:CubicO group peptidase (beta-lactamase class C family)
VFEPGSRWAYSSYGFLLLGALIEQETGQTSYKYVWQHIFTPAGMTRAGSLPEDQAVPDRAIGYTKQARTSAWLPSPDTLPYRGTSAGGGYSTGRGSRTVRPRTADPSAAQPPTPPSC